MIKISNGSKKFKDFELKNINITFPDKGLIFILGKSGSGKSTLLNIIGGMDKFDSGDILYNDTNLSSLTAQELEIYRSGTVGFVFQEYNLLHSLNVSKNISLSEEIMAKHSTDEEIANVLSLVDLSGYEKRKINELSGGQQQRVAIARALIKKPQILLCDEPTGALDAATGEQIFSLLKTISSEKLVIVVTHDEESAVKYGDQIINISNGEIINDNLPLISNENNTSLELLSKKCFKKTLFSFSLSHLLLKKFRFILIILSSIICLSLLAVSVNISSINENEIITESMYKNKKSYIGISDYLEDKKLQSDGFSEDMYVDFMQKNNFDYGIKIYGNKYNYKLYNVSPSYTENDFYVPNIKGICEINDELIEKLGFTLYGSLPKNDYEIVLPSYFFSIYQKYGYEKFGTNKAINTYDDLIGMEIYFERISNYEDQSKDMKVVGILETGFDISKYYADENSSDYYSNKLYVYGILNHGMENVIYLSEGYYERNFKEENNVYSSSRHNLERISLFKEDDLRGDVKEIKSTDFSNIDYIYSKKNNLEKNEIIIPFKLSSLNLDNLINNYCINNFDEAKVSLQNKYPDKNDTVLLSNYISDLESNDMYDEYLNLDDKSVYKKILQTAAEKIISSGKTYSLGLGHESITEVSICGLYYSEDDSDHIFTSQEMVNEFKEYKCENLNIEYIVLPTNNNKETCKKIINLTKVKDNKTVNGTETDISYKIENEFTAGYRNYTNDIRQFASLFLYSSIILALGIIFIYVYYSDGVISESKKEIAVLYSLGMRKKDIKIIYYAETLLITLFTCLISCIFTIVLISIFNLSFDNIKLLTISIGINWYSIIILIAFGLITSFTGTAVALRKLFKSNPVQMVKNKE